MSGVNGGALGKCQYLTMAVTASSRRARQKKLVGEYVKLYIVGLSDSCDFDNFCKTVGFLK